jgi:hypothetical protein
MTYSKPLLTTLVRRKRALPNAGAHTLFFHAPKFGKSGIFLDPSEVPDFDGEEAEFEYEKVQGTIKLTRLVRVTTPSPLDP